MRIRWYARLGLLQISGFQELGATEPLQLLSSFKRDPFFNLEMEFEFL